MRELTIVSPHRDDVPFSLYLCLSRWCSLPIQVNVVTVFTVSEYAPRANLSETGREAVRSAVTYLRRREDRRVFNLIDKRIKVQPLNLLDATLRLGINVDSVCKASEGNTAGTYSEVDALSNCFKRFLLRALVLAPLALGDHVDHLIVRAAVIKSSAPHKLAFYEDLPYAAWVTTASVRETIHQIEQTTNAPLKPFIVRHKSQISRKREVIRQYKSQISGADAAEIAGFAVNYHGGERIWVPKRSRAWRALTRDRYA
ncbi:MAG: PIG-L family deacetylase [Acidobacteriaceae bacterium]|nr:PIG-L family deacetylase [Acidobacteriaceae bacterium]MBV9780227.1 PIG-L family deacetylase [Acidobacteriaceae bacterium]